MAVYQPFFQSSNIFVFGFKPQGSGTGPGPGTYARSYPPLHQSVRIIRFGFTPQGNSTPPVAAVETNTHFVRRIVRHGESYQRFRFNTQAADPSSAVAHPVGKITRLSLDGYGVRRNGSFAGKPPGGSGHPVGKITRLSLDGYGVRRNGSFAGKPAGGGGVAGDVPHNYIFALGCGFGGGFSS